MIKTSAISSSLLALAPLDEETQIWSFLFASSHSRWLRKVQSGVTEADIIGPNFAYGNVALWEGLSSKHLPGPVLLNFSVQLWTGVSTMANPFDDKNISNITFLTCFGSLGWHDTDRIISVWVESPKVAKESTVGYRCSWHYQAKLCQWKCGLRHILMHQ